MTTTQADTRSLDELCINTIRTLSMDAVQNANSGHPGAPMALAPIGYVLYTRVMRHSPRNPDWPDRDRFVLSAGHASMLLYSTLYLSGYGLTLDDLKTFRQLNSPTAGHPEYGHAAGIETTTGPLGQGISNSVGLALAERMLAERFNRPGHQIVDHYTYTIASDGDMQEGVQSEAASIGGHLGLGRLIAFYDDNHISIEGDTALAMSEDVGKRYEAYGWDVVHLGEDFYGWPSQEPFFVPDGVLDHVRELVAERAKAHEEWEEAFAAYKEAFPEEAAELERMPTHENPEGWADDLPKKPADPKGMATRKASNEVLQ